MSAAAAVLAPAISKNAAKKAAKRAAREALKASKRGGAPPPPTDLLPLVNKHAKDCRRYKVLLSYDGAGFHGWLQQHPPGQAPLRTVGGVVEVAFRTALQQKVRVCPAGRTDAGVSASGQVCQFDAVVADAASPDALTPRLNAALPPDVRVRSCRVVASDFAAMGNLWKRYVYTCQGEDISIAPEISNLQDGAAAAAAEQPESASRKEALLAFCRKTLQNDPRAAAVTEINLAAMQLAATELEGQHDFASFQSKGGRQTTVRTIHRLKIEPALYVRKQFPPQRDFQGGV